MHGVSEAACGFLEFITVLKRNHELAIRQIVISKTQRSGA